MPWKTSSLPLIREQFVQCALRASQPFVQICGDYEISRKTGYKWLRRYHAGGRNALDDASRRPRHHANEKPAYWKARLRQLRTARPHWGAKKLHQRLRELYPYSRLPSIRTLGRWLSQLALTHPNPPRARRGPPVPHPGLTAPRRLHQVWTVDFKGWFLTADAQRQEPLTVREAKSRFLLDIRLLSNQSDAAVRGAMTRLFRRHGLPSIIRVDNGAPFAGKGALGLSRLSVWWLRLGIRVEFTRRARPGDNAAHEQMHGRYKAEVLSRAAPNRRLQQQRSDRWRHDYNQCRPHEALGQRCPAQLYRPSKRAMPLKLPVLQYAPSLPVRRVRSHGDIKWQGRLRFIGRAFVGQSVVLLARGPGHHAVLFGSLLIGELHHQDTHGMRPAYWKRIPSHPLLL